VACQTGVSRGSERAFGFVIIQNPMESCQTALILLFCVDLVGQCLMPGFDRYLGRKERLLDQPRHQSVCFCMPIRLYYSGSLLTFFVLGPSSYRCYFYTQEWMRQTINQTIVLEIAFTECNLTSCFLKFVLQRENLGSRD